jgi:hypothetical protein
MHSPLVIIAIFSVVFPATVFGHGMMIDPVNRASRWREGFAGPKEYTDNQLNCGGRNTQWAEHNGKCGVCGDEYGIANPRFQYPGAFATNPPIVKTYQQGQQIDVKVRITANHLGYFTFRLAPLVKQPITQNELDKTILKMPNEETNWQLPADETGVFTIRLQLPQGVACNHCVLQWWYTTGNNWVRTKNLL